MLRATAACNFSTSQLQKVVRECCVLYILTCKCASRHFSNISRLLIFFLSAPFFLAALLFQLYTVYIYIAQVYMYRIHTHVCVMYHAFFRSCLLILLLLLFDTSCTCFLRPLLHAWFLSWEPSQGQRKSLAVVGIKTLPGAWANIARVDGS